MTIPIRELEANVTESMKIEGARVMHSFQFGLTKEQLATRIYAHMEDVRRRNEENTKRRRNYGYAD